MNGDTPIHKQQPEVPPIPPAPEIPQPESPVIKQSVLDEATAQLDRAIQSGLHEPRMADIPKIRHDVLSEAINQLDNATGQRLNGSRPFTVENRTLAEVFPNASRPVEIKDWADLMEAVRDIKASIDNLTTIIQQRGIS